MMAASTLSLIRSSIAGLLCRTSPALKLRVVSRAENLSLRGPRRMAKQIRLLQCNIAMMNY